MNPKLGDVAIKVGKASYILNMGVNALCAIEGETERAARQRDPAAQGESALEVVQRCMTALRLSDIRLLFWGGLQRHHPTIGLAEAGDIVQAVNLAEKKAYEYIVESMKLCSPDIGSDEGEAGADAAAGPPQAVAGTGTASS